MEPENLGTYVVVRERERDVSPKQVASKNTANAICVDRYEGEPCIEMMLLDNEGMDSIFFDSLRTRDIFSTTAAAACNFYCCFRAVTVTVEQLAWLCQSGNQASAAMAAAASAVRLTYL